MTRMRGAAAVLLGVVAMAVVCRTQDTVRTISSAAELIAWHNEVFTSSTTVTANVKLGGDIVFGAQTSQNMPIGHVHNTAFSGTFDGNGHTIKGLQVNTDAEYAGLFV